MQIPLGEKGLWTTAGGDQIKAFGEGEKKRRRGVKFPGEQTTSAEKYSPCNIRKWMSVTKVPRAA